MVFVVMALLGMVAGLAQAQPAQQGPSRLTAEQIIAALKPTGPIQSGTRGIRAASSSPALAANEAAVRHGPGPKLPAIDLNVHFEFGSAELTQDAARTLDELGRALSSQSLAGYRFRIEGHTDTVGTADYNRNLSDQRAATVARYLEGKFGVGASRLETVGLGESMLLVPTPPQTPEMRNRRVHVVNLGA
jgi:outer membrane protein OmpA-like peptidoglycan-associated protein